MKAKKLITSVLLAATIASQSLTAFAAPADNDPSGDQHTTIGILESTNTAGQVSFSVPLYVTLAAVKNQADLLTPTGYDIKNTETGGTSIAVMNVSITGVGTWATVDADPTQDKQVKLSIGKLQMPAVTNGTTQTIDVSTVTDPGDFYDKAGGKYRAIKPSETLSQAVTQVAEGATGYTGLEIAGKVNAQDRSDVAASAQFRITYLITPLDAQGNPVGLTYVGDDKPWN